MCFASSATYMCYSNNDFWAVSVALLVVVADSARLGGVVVVLSSNSSITNMGF